MRPSGRWRGSTPACPDGMQIKQSYDTSVFVKGAITEVYKTLGIAIALVVLVIFLFLGSARATLVPAVTVPVSLVATFLVLWMLGFSINILTLLALVLAIGSGRRRRHRGPGEYPPTDGAYGETRLVAAFRGTRQVAFAVIATTVVLVAVFVPIAFLQGDVGRLFSEFALTMAAAVGFSSFVALSLSPMLASQVLPEELGKARLAHAVDRVFDRIRDGYLWLLRGALVHKWIVGLVFVAILGRQLLAARRRSPDEYAPKEDRGAFFVLVNGPRARRTTT